jgi:hypothetical protein
VSGPAWLPDPTGRHEYRWWEGDRWSSVVADGGVESEEPVPGLPDPQGGPSSPGRPAVGDKRAAEDRTVVADDPAVVDGPEDAPVAEQGPAHAGPRSTLTGRARALAATVVVAGLVAGVLVGRTAGGRTTTEEVDVSAAGDVSDEELTELMTTGLSGTLDGVMTLDELACAADGVIGALGRERLVELGVGTTNPYEYFEPQYLTPEERQTYYRAQVECVADSRMAEFWIDWHEYLGNPGRNECVGNGLADIVGTDGMRDMWATLRSVTFAVESDVAPREHQAAVGDLVGECLLDNPT